MGLKEVLAGAGRAGHEDGRWTRWRIRRRPRAPSVGSPGSWESITRLWAPGCARPGTEPGHPAWHHHRRGATDQGAGVGGSRAAKSQRDPEERIGLSIAAECERPSRWSASTSTPARRRSSGPGRSARCSLAPESRSPRAP